MGKNDLELSASSGFLVALQLSDSSLPIGRYVHSNGMEGMLTDPPINSSEIVEVIEAVLLHGFGRCDAVAAAHSHRMFTLGDLDQIHETDELLLATKLLKSARNASTSCGRQLAKLSLEVWPHRLLNKFCHKVLQGRAGNLAIVTAALLASRGLCIELTIMTELRGAVNDLLAAAVRLGMMGAMEAQIRLHEAMPLIVQATETALALSLEDMSITTPELDIAMLNLQRNPLRLFAS